MRSGTELSRFLKVFIPTLSQLESSSKGKNYRLQKSGTVIENYLINFPINIYLPIFTHVEISNK